MKTTMIILAGVLLSTSAYALRCPATDKLQNYFISLDPTLHNPQVDLVAETRFSNEARPLLQEFDQLLKKAPGRANQFGCLLRLSAAGYKWDDGTAIGFAADYLKKEKGLHGAYRDALNTLKDQCRAREFAESVKVRMCHNKNGEEESILQSQECEKYFSKKDVFQECESSRQYKRISKTARHRQSSARQPASVPRSRPGKVLYEPIRNQLIK